MDNRTTYLWTLAIVAVVGIVGILAYGSMQRTKLVTDAQIVKAQEYTKRAEGRHELLDILGLIRKQKDQ